MEMGCQKGGHPSPAMPWAASSDCAHVVLEPWWTWEGDCMGLEVALLNSKTCILFQNVISTLKSRLGNIWEQ